MTNPTTRLDTTTSTRLVPARFGLRLSRAGRKGAGVFLDMGCSTTLNEMTNDLHMIMGYSATRTDT
jgi:hypothetical protein